MEHIKNRLLIVCTLIAIGSVDAQQLKEVQGAEQAVAYHQQGRFAGWPANNGAWIFDGDNILVGFTEAEYVLQEGHNLGEDQTSWLSRSNDGGLTWKAWNPKNYVGDFGDQPELTDLKKEVDFTQNGFAMRVVGTAYHGAEDPRGHFFYTTNRGKKWRGPHTFGDFQNHPELKKYWDEVEITPRTDYIILGKKECIIFMSARPKGKFAKDRLFCIKTTDGGKTFQFHGWVVKPFHADEVASAVKVPLYDDESLNPWSTQCRAVMSESFLLSDGKMLTVMRRKYSGKGVKSRNWVDAYASTDGGKTWTFQSQVGDAGSGNGNPPALALMQDGRLCAVYGERDEGTIQIAYSSDEGRTWSEPQILYDAFWSEDMELNDLGYPRVITRSDGKMVAIFYYSTKERQGQIHATIWDPKTN